MDSSRYGRRGEEPETASAGQGLLPPAGSQARNHPDTLHNDMQMCSNWADSRCEMKNFWPGRQNIRTVAYRERSGTCPGLHKHARVCTS